MTIKRGVSLYSFQEEYFLRTLSLEDCIVAAAGCGLIVRLTEPGRRRPRPGVIALRGDTLEVMLGSDMPPFWPFVAP